MPPPTAFRPKALLKMEMNTAGTMEILVIRMTIEPIMYRITMKGTIFSVTAAILFKPPTITSPAISITTSPVAQLGIPKADSILPAMELTWVILPIPKDARKQKMENSTASTAPMVLQPFFAPKPSRR